MLSTFVIVSLQESRKVFSFLLTKMNAYPLIFFRGSNEVGIFFLFDHKSNVVILTPETMDIFDLVFLTDTVDA